MQQMEKYQKKHGTKKSKMGAVMNDGKKKGK